MRIKIGLVVTKYFNDLVVELQKEFKNKCELVYLPYTSFNEIKDIYLNNKISLDGFIFGGLAPYKYFLNEFTSFEKPFYHFEMDNGSFYKLLFNISMKNNLLDYSRVFIDFINESNNYLGLKEILPKERFPITLSKIDTFSENLEEAIIDEHVRLWTDKKIDLSITRVTCISEKLEEKGINHVLAIPSMDYVKNVINDVLTDLEYIVLKNNQICIANISIENIPDSYPNTNDDLDYKFALLYDALVNFNNKNDANFVIQRIILGFEVYTTRDSLLNITNNFSGCSLLKYLQEKLDFSVRIGWGSGLTLYQAKKNAQLANKEASAHGGNCSYAITEDDSIIGPLNSETLLQYSNYQSKEVADLSANLKVSPLTIQKIIGVTNKLNTNELSAEDLATNLGITLRSANRILSKIVDNNGASVIQEKQEKLRGRPKKIYSIHFKYF